MLHAFTWTLSIPLKPGWTLHNDLISLVLMCWWIYFPLGKDPFANHLSHYEHTLQGTRGCHLWVKSCAWLMTAKMLSVSLSSRHLSTTCESQSRRTSPSSSLMSFDLATISFIFFSYFKPLTQSKCALCRIYLAPHLLLISHHIKPRVMCDYLECVTHQRNRVNGFLKCKLEWCRIFPSSLWRPPAEKRTFPILLSRCVGPLH